MSATDKLRSFAESREGDAILVCGGLTYGDARAIFAEIERLRAKLLSVLDGLQVPNPEKAALELDADLLRLIAAKVADQAAECNSLRAEVAAQSILPSLPQPTVNAMQEWVQDEWRIELERLLAENERLREAGVGYSQQTVDAITKEREALRSELERLRQSNEAATRELRTLRNAAVNAHERAEKAEAERDAMLKKDQLNYDARCELQAQVNDITAERDALRADAERYRWLRSYYISIEMPHRLWTRDSPARENPKELDAAIDAAKSPTA